MKQEQQKGREFAKSDTQASALAGTADPGRHADAGLRKPIRHASYGHQVIDTPETVR